MTETSWVVQSPCESWWVDESYFSTREDGEAEIKNLRDKREDCDFRLVKRTEEVVEVEP